MNSSHLIPLLLKFVLFLTLAVLIPESSAVPLRQVANGAGGGGGRINGSNQRGSNNNSNRISIRGGGLSLNAGGQKRFRISRGNKRENNGFYTTRFGKRSVPHYLNDNIFGGMQAPRQKKSHNKNKDHLKTLNQEVAAYAVEGNDYNGDEVEEVVVELIGEEPQMTAEEEDGARVVRSTPLGRPPSVQPRNIKGIDESGQRVVCVYSGMRNFYICGPDDSEEAATAVF